MASMSKRSVVLNRAKSRPAPPPPNLSNASSSAKCSVDVSKVLFASRPVAQDGGGRKKPAPPRPPPPKVPTVQAVFQKQASEFSSAHKTELLIDWSSPPPSPTAGRSSSARLSGDRVSLQSFSSDSSGCPTTARTGSSAARSESGFESEPESWSESLTSQPAPLNGAGQTQTFSKPTIIRPNRSRANQQSARMPPQTSHLEQLEKLSATTKSSLAGSIPNLLDLDSENSDSSDAASPDYSPPEPNIPPPALPPGFSTSGSPLPPRQPYAISLYKYQSGHPGDLDFQEGEEIVLMKKINDEWYQGRCNSKEGMFPSNFVRIVVPLDQSIPHAPATLTPYSAVALFPFQAETSQDLSLQEGDIVQVTDRLDQDWLYGFSSDGRSGQFPQSFTRRCC